MTDLSGRVAVVTGAGRGVGRRAALRLAAHGAAVALVARSEAQLQETAGLIAYRGGRAHIVMADVSRPDSLDRIRDGVTRGLGPPSILINAAGVFGPIASVRDGDSAAWMETIMINTLGCYITCRAFVGGMIDAGWGRIVNVTSAASLHTPGPSNSAYGTSKAALNQFTRHLAAELDGTGVTANVIHPGDVKTEMWATIRDGAGRLGAAGAAYSQWAEWVVQTGGDDPEKAADLIADLMGPQAGTINGQFLWIKDGLQPQVPSWGASGDSQPWRNESHG